MRPGYIGLQWCWPSNGDTSHENSVALLRIASSTSPSSSLVPASAFQLLVQARYFATELQRRYDRPLTPAGACDPDPLLRVSRVIVINSAPISNLLQSVFTRATLCLARSLPSCSVCLSVRHTDCFCLSDAAATVGPQFGCAADLWKLRRSDHISDALIRLHWLLISERIKFKVAVLTYVLDGRAPSYLGPFTFVADLPSRRDIRSSGTVAPAASFKHRYRYIIPPSTAEHFRLLVHNSGTLYRWRWRQRRRWRYSAGD